MRASRKGLTLSLSYSSLTGRSHQQQHDAAPYLDRFPEPF